MSPQAKEQAWRQHQEAKNVKNQVEHNETGKRVAVRVQAARSSNRSLDPLTEKLRPLYFAMVMPGYDSVGNFRIPDEFAVVPTSLAAPYAREAVTWPSDDATGAVDKLCPPGESLVASFRSLVCSHLKMVTVPETPPSIRSTFLTLTPRFAVQNDDGSYSYATTKPFFGTDRYEPLRFCYLGAASGVQALTTEATPTHNKLYNTFDPTDGGKIFAGSFDGDPASASAFYVDQGYAVTTLGPTTGAFLTLRFTAFDPSNVATWMENQVSVIWDFCDGSKIYEQVLQSGRTITAGQAATRAINLSFPFPTADLTGLPINFNHGYFRVRFHANFIEASASGTARIAALGMNIVVMNDTPTDATTEYTGGKPLDFMVHEPAPYFASSAESMVNSAKIVGHALTFTNQAAALSRSGNLIGYQTPAGRTWLSYRTSQGFYDSLGREEGNLMLEANNGMHIWAAPTSDEDFDYLEDFEYGSGTGVVASYYNVLRQRSAIMIVSRVSSAEGQAATVTVGKAVEFRTGSTWISRAMPEFSSDVIMKRLMLEMRNHPKITENPSHTKEFWSNLISSGGKIAKTVADIAPLLVSLLSAL